MDYENLTQWEENLRASFQPNHWICKYFPPGSEQMSDAICGAFQRDSTEEEDNQHHVGEDCGDVDDFAALRDALNHAKIDERPCDDKR